MNKNPISYAVECEKLSFQIGNRFLLKDVSMKVEKGSHWHIYGMNGSGKTTLLSILSGFRRQTGGTLHILGEEPSADNILSLRRKIGWVSSSFFDTVYQNETVIEIVLSGKFGTFGLDNGITAEDYRRATDLLAQLGLAGKEYRRYRQLSKGQKQNVLIARAFLNRPEILILDEPCSGLDVLAREKFMKLLEQIVADTDITVLYVSHETDEITDLFENLLMLRNGRVFASGKVEELFEQTNLTSFFRQPVALTQKERPIISAVGEENQLKSFLL